MQAILRHTQNPELNSGLEGLQAQLQNQILEIALK
jgi:hypothetical protein